MVRWLISLFFFLSSSNHFMVQFTNVYDDAFVRLFISIFVHTLARFNRNLNAIILLNN